jgi:hypothetical protein
VDIAMEKFNAVYNRASEECKKFKPGSSEYARIASLMAAMNVEANNLQPQTINRSDDYRLAQIDQLTARFDQRLQKTSEYNNKLYDILRNASDKAWIPSSWNRRNSTMTTPARRRGGSWC